LNQIKIKIKMKHVIFSLLVLTGIQSMISCGNQQTATAKVDRTTVQPKMKEETVDYTLDTVNMKGFVVYDESSDKKRPAVLVVPEWWGLNDYTRSRARQLAGLGYIAFAIDLYGNGQVAANPDEAKKWTTPFYQDMPMAKARFDAALVKLKSYPQVDTNNIAAIGYCFGGTQVLNAARLGDNLKGVVSFHGGLAGAPADKNLLKAKILVCHGEADQFVKPAEVAQFKKQMDSIQADYTFKSYPGATHAFTNPDATLIGQKFKMPIEYNAAADSASWKDMKSFFSTVLK
jgi:dienelactone hydrolase